MTLLIRLARLALAMLRTLAWTLFCPALTGAATFAVLGPAVITCQLIMGACFAWGAIRARDWQARWNALLTALPQVRVLYVTRPI